ncbi:non-ribosomal peptide synthetase [Salinispora fenicalii]|uniref:non-ribosomal peptide synthetase n=1 Tax=Salinispora fenicalii TaxID=1137263 RepID=UPI000481C4DF|nr:non-ribosomal peptide synthetase [Salinispora fenicalii]
MTISPTLHSGFLAHAAKHPETVAVFSAAGELTYGRLDQTSAALAERLSALGVGPGVPIGVCVERTPDLLVAILGVLRAGACYLPLDPQYPASHLAFMVADSETRLVVTTRASRDTCPDGCTPLVLEEVELEEVETVANPSPVASVPDDSAYVIYTSGSTGVPKGVPIRHSSCAAMLGEVDRIFADCDMSGIAAVTSVCFDLSVLEIFSALSRGRSLVLVDSAAHLPESSHAERVTHVSTVPSAMTSLLDAQAVPAGLRTVVLGGEPVRRSLVDRIYRETNVDFVFNGYGPTEGTVFCTFKLVSPDESGEPSIGTPSLTARVYVLDEELRSSPVGEPGELYLGGDGLTWGYLKRPGLTAERFVPDPQMAGERIYRTGDIARLTEAGEFEFIGRSDHQVKVRGKRVELEEVEARLTDCPEVRMAAAVVREPAADTRTLIAYVVPAGAIADENGPWLDTNLQTVIRQKLGAMLPDYMVPETIVFLPALPLSPVGKLDRTALPRPPAVEAMPVGDYATTDTERALAEIWGALLDRSPRSIGMRDTLYDLGGNSLLLVRLARQISKRFSRKVGVADLFRFRDIDSLAKWLEDESGSSPEVIEQARRRASIRRSVVRGQNRSSST